MEYNKPLIAMLIGAVSTIPAEILTRVLVFMGIGKYSIYQLDSFLITLNRPSPIIGLIVNFFVGGIIAVILYYAFQKIGQDFMVFKSMVAGGLFWLVFEYIFTSNIEGKFIDIRPVSDYFVHLSGALVFGATLGLLFERYFINKATQESE